jgi:hypothetical protein
MGFLKIIKIMHIFYELYLNFENKHNHIIELIKL